MVSDELLKLLLQVNAIKFGEFKLKSGILSPIYFDFRLIISYPNIMRMVANEMWEVVKPKYENNDFTHICGVPFTALPIASTMSVLKDVPMLMKRKEAKTYGTGALVEGVYTNGTKCLIVEDVVTSGMSVFETVKALKELGIIVTDVVVLLDRNQGAVQNLKKAGIIVHTLIDIELFLSQALQMDLLTKDCFTKVMDFVKANCVQNDSLFLSQNKDAYLSLEKRLKQTKNHFNKKLLKVMIDKRSNLCVAVDKTKVDEILDLAERVF